MRHRVSLRIIGLLLPLSIAGCTTASTQSPIGTTPIVGASASLPAAADGPVTNWDHPFMQEGTTVSASQLSASPAAYGLTFTPTDPAFPLGKLRWVDVSQHATVAYMFDFSADPALPGDARVEVQQSGATMTESEFASIHWAGTYSQIEYKATIITLRQFNGIGDALFIHNAILFEVFGPAVPPSVAVGLAEELVDQLG